MNASSASGYAFFDLDQTLVPYDTQALFCQHVLHREGYRRAYLGFFLPAVPLKALGLIGTRELKRAFLAYLYKMPKDRLKGHVNTFVYENVAPLIYPEVRHELHRHQQAGRTTILNTASPDFYAKAIAEYLGFHHCFATNVDLGNGPTVPLLPKIPGPNNKREAKLVAMAHLLPPGQLDKDLGTIPNSYAYSDSHADLPMLKLAEHAFMVHPTPELARVGAVRRWETLYPVRPFTSKMGFRAACFRQAFGL
jgi:HAD superfamily hydrolase (TIGR01490 family)